MFNLVGWIQTAGYLGIAAIVFGESGVLIGLFLPGDSLLFTAGFLASQGYLHIGLLIPVVFVAAIAGDSFGYALGKRLGPRIFTKKDSFFFHQDHLTRAAAFYERHGGKTIVIARFMPIIRTLAPIVAGVGRMRYGAFLIYNIIGAAAWAIGLTTLGYILGKSVPNVDRYLLPIIALIIIISGLPTLISLAKQKYSKRR